MRWTSFAIIYFLSISSVVACPPSDLKDPFYEMRIWADQAIVRINTVGTEECTNTGTGFFINAAGYIITAGHVIPKECDNENVLINVRWTKNPTKGELSDPITARVVARSSLDVAVLSLSSSPDDARQFLRLEPITKDVSMYKYRCILIPSHYFEQTDTLSSFAEISSVALQKGDRRWALSGEGFNASRSGSPIILANGQVIALFLARPSSDRNNIIENRAYVLPLSVVPKNEIDFNEVASASGNLYPFLTLPQLQADFPNNNTSPVPMKSLEPVITSFGISITEQGKRMGEEHLPVYLYRDRKFSKYKYSDIWPLFLNTLTKGGSVVRQVTVKRSFPASPGYFFDPSTLKIVVEELNPPSANLPDRICTDEADTGCYAILADGRILELRINLYPGAVDGRRSWIDAEVRIAERPDLNRNEN